MSINQTHVDFLLARDGEVEDGAEATLCAILQMRDYLRINKLQVKAFFKDVKALGSSITLFMSPDSWEARMANASKVLSHFQSADAPGWVSAMVNLHAWNDERVANGERITWSLQGIYGLISTPKAVKAEAAVTEEVTEATTEATADTATTPLIDVMIANVQHLTADELVRLAVAVAERQALSLVA